MALAGGPLTLVVDASAAFQACVMADGFADLGGEQLVAPPLMWSELRSALHESMWRGAISKELARHGLDRLRRAPIAPRAPKGLDLEAWRIADQFGWAKTYDAEYVALALLLRCRLLTRDAALRRATARLGFVVGPTEL